MSDGSVKGIPMKPRLPYSQFGAIGRAEPAHSRAVAQGLRPYILKRHCQDVIEGYP
jgi:hypothetical protein